MYRLSLMDIFNVFNPTQKKYLCEKDQHICILTTFLIFLQDNPELFWLLKSKMASTPGTDYQKGWQPWMSITTIVFFPIFRCRYIYRIVTPIYFALHFFFLTLGKRGKNCGQSRMSINIQNGNTTIVYFLYFFFNPWKMGAIMPTILDVDKYTQWIHN